MSTRTRTVPLVSFALKITEAETLKKADAAGNVVKQSCLPSLDGRHHSLCVQPALNPST